MKLPIIIKRIAAYTLDILLVTFIASLLSKTPLNPHNENYDNLVEEYSLEYENYSNLLTDLNDAYETDNFDTENVVEIFNKYDLELKDLTSDEEVTRENYDAILESVNSSVGEKFDSKLYNIDKYSVYSSIISILVILLYFVVLEYFMNGQTIGKKLFNIKVVSHKEDKKLSILKYLLRACILYGVLISIINLILLLTLKESSFIEVNSIVYMVAYLIEFTNYGMIIFRKDKRGLHDLITGTKVVEK